MTGQLPFGVYVLAAEHAVNELAFRTGSETLLVVALVTHLAFPEEVRRAVWGIHTAAFSLLVAVVYTKNIYINYLVRLTLSIQYLHYQ